MRATLEQLKAMSDDELRSHWRNKGFPFEHASCGGCLTMHNSMRWCEAKNDDEHISLHKQIVVMGFRPGFFDPKIAREHIEELYALRLFYDSLYPQETPAPGLPMAVAQNDHEHDSVCTKKEVEFSCGGAGEVLRKGS